LPTYQYACTECGHEFDTVQSFSDASLTECPECTGKLRKVFNAVGIVFKGSGFYRTDSRSSGSSTTGASGSGDGAGGDKPSTTKDAGKSGASTDGGSSSSSSSTKGSAA
jgi:putative FmdB family regulatory protein